jgi:hypothetical protein
MLIGRHRGLFVLLGATSLCAPGLAMAKAPDPATQTLAARLERLEAEVTRLRTELTASRGEQAQTAASAAQTAASAAQTASALEQARATSEQAAAKVAALEAKHRPEGFRDGASTIRIGGFVKLVSSNTRYGNGAVMTNTLGRDFYLPQQIPVGGTATRDQDFSAKQTRLWVNLQTDVAGHTLKGYLETDFQTTANAAPNVGGGGSQRTTNGYTLALRRAYLQLDRWTIGEDWTTFQNTGVLPESTDYVGGVEGTVFVRQPLVRYSAPLGKQTTLHVAIENPESGTATLGTATLVENGTDRLPDFTARLAWAGKRAELSLAGLARQVRVENAGVAATRSGFGASASAKLFLNEAKTADARVMVTYGDGISRYVGLNFAPDAVYVPASGRLEDVKVFAALAAVRLPLSPQLRINLIGSYQSAQYADSLAAAGIAAFNQRAWSGAANLFYSPVSAVDLGIEYRHGERRLVSGVTGTTDRMEFAAKYTF